MSFFLQLVAFTLRRASDLSVCHHLQYPHVLPASLRLHLPTRLARQRSTQKKKKKKRSQCGCAAEEASLARAVKV